MSHRAMIAGVGLIGGSIGMALREQGWHVSGVDEDEKRLAEAEKLGAEEGLMLDSHGFVSTCNSTNFFIVVDKEIWTST